MRREHVVERVVAKERVAHFSRLVAIAEPRPERGAPRPRPAAARIAREGAAGKRDLCSLSEFRRRLGRDRGTWIDCVEVARVPVLVALNVAVGLPFLKLTPRTDLVLEELWLKPRDFLDECVINIEFFRGGEYAAEQLAHYLLVVCNAVLARTMLGAPAVLDDDSSVRTLLELRRNHELRRALHERPADFLKVLPVAREEPVVVALRREPRRARKIPAPSAAADRVRARAVCISLRIRERRAGARLRNGHGREHPVGKRREALREVRRVRAPVVHLDVDVRVVVAVPRRVVGVVPYSLQVRGERARTRAGNEQVATEVELQRDKSGVLGAFPHAVKAHAGGDRLVAFAEVEAHAVVVLFVVGDVAIQGGMYLGIAFCLDTVLGRGERTHACRGSQHNHGEASAVVAEHIRPRSVFESVR